MAAERDLRVWREQLVRTKKELKEEEILFRERRELVARVASYDRGGNSLMATSEQSWLVAEQGNERMAVDVEDDGLG